MSTTTIRLQQADDTYKVVTVTSGAPSSGTSSPDLDAIAALDVTQAGVIASDGAGWIRKTYSSLKTALAITKTDLSLNNVDNTSDALKPISNATQTALNGKQPIASNLTSLAGVDSTTAGTIANDGSGWVKKTYGQFKTALTLVKADVGLANVDNTSDVNKPVSTAQTTAINSAVIGHINQYHPFDFRRYGAVPDGTDCTNFLITAQNDIAAVTTQNMKFQNNVGGYQQGTAANGGGELHVAGGLFTIGNLPNGLFAHRLRIAAEGWGSGFIRKTGTSGNWLYNRRDATAHIGYLQLFNMTLHLNKNASSGAPTGTAVLFQGDTTNTFNSTLDEDYDIHCIIENCQLLEGDGDAIRMEGSGANRAEGNSIKAFTGLGIYSFQDNFILGNDIGHVGTRAIWIDGDSCTVDNNKGWYTGEVTASQGQGLYATADTGVGSGNWFQDTAAQGVLLDNAFGWALQVVVDSASKSSAGTYAGLDLYASQYNNIQATIRNRYRSDGTFGPCRDGLNHAGGSTLNYGEVVVAQGVWGVQNTLKSGSVTNASKIRVNGTLI